MSLLRIAAVRPLSGFRVELTLTNGEVVERDLTALLAGPVFEGIRGSEEEFGRVRVEDGTLAWPTGADLCPDTVIWGGLPPENSAHYAA